MKVIAVFEECPDCKVDARLMAGLVQEEVAKGNMGKDVVPCISMNIYSNIDPRKPLITGGRIPGARVASDICTKCGRTFTVKIETGYVTIPTRPGVPPMFA